MSKIPEYEAGASSNTGSTGGTASPEAFSAGISISVGDALERSTRLVSRGLRIRENAKEYAKTLDDTRWASTAYEQEKRRVSEFMADPANNTAEDFATKVDNFANERIGQYTQDAAPSPEALKTFQENFQTYANGKYESALGLSFQNKVNNAVSDVGNQVSDAMANYRKSKQVPGSTGLSDLTDSVAHIGNSIETQFRAHAPNLADKLQADLTTQTVLASMGQSPEAAKTFLNNSNYVDEQQRRTLNHEIDQAANTRNIVERDGFNTLRADFLTRAEQGKASEFMPLSHYEAFYPKDEAQAQKTHDDNYLRTVYSANSFIADNAPKNAEAQLSALSKLKEGINTKMDQDAFDIVGAKMRTNLRLQDENPVAFLQANNPQVKSLRQAAIDASAEEQPARIKSLHDAILKYQGVAPTDVKASEKDMYLNRPLNDRHLLGTDEAVKAAGDLNQATPKEFISKMQQLLTSYPDEQHQYIVFNDLVTQPKAGSGLKQEYQLAWQNKDAWWLPTYVGALHSAKSMALPEAQQKEITSRIEANPTWLKFQSSMIGDNFQRGSQIQGFKEGIQAYSQALSTQGIKPKDAADRAVGMLISETLGFTTVNGKPLSILREQEPGMPHRTDEQVNDLGRRLGVMLQFIDPTKVSQNSFPSLNIMGTNEQLPERLHALRNSITSRGFFQTGPDGKSASLYYSDDNGSPFQITDRNGHPFNVKFSDVPDYRGVPLNFDPFPGVGLMEKPMLPPPGVQGVVKYGLVQPLKTYENIPQKFSENDTNWWILPTLKGTR